MRAAGTGVDADCRRSVRRMASACCRLSGVCSDASQQERNRGAPPDRSTRAPGAQRGRVVAAPGEPSPRWNCASADRGSSATASVRAGAPRRTVRPRGGRVPIRPQGRPTLEGAPDPAHHFECARGLSQRVQAQGIVDEHGLVAGAPRQRPGRIPRRRRRPIAGAGARDTIGQRPPLQDPSIPGQLEGSGWREKDRQQRGKARRRHPRHRKGRNRQNRDGGAAAERLEGSLPVCRRPDTPHGDTPRRTIPHAGTVWMIAPRRRRNRRAPAAACAMALLRPASNATCVSAGHNAR